MNSTLQYTLDQIRRAEVDPEPFPHVLIPAVFPDDFYRQLLSAIPDPESFEKVQYPGTGFGRRARNYHPFGLAYRDFESLPVLKEVGALLRAEDFSRALLEKFSTPVDGVAPIPANKRRFFAAGARDFAPVFDLHIDLPGYEIPPHPDVEQKIVTFQFFLTRDSSLHDFGTLLCKPKQPKDDGTTETPGFLRSVGRVIASTSGSLRLTQTAVWERFQHSSLAMEMGLGIAPTWLPWRLFEIAKIAPALPNHFLAFAANQRSYHAVRMDLGPEQPLWGRTVIRGFIRSGQDAENWTQFQEAASAAEV